MDINEAMKETQAGYEGAAHGRRAQAVHLQVLLVESVSVHM